MAYNVLTELLRQPLFVSMVDIWTAVRREMVGHQKMSDGVDQDEAYIKVTALCLKRNIHKYSKSS